MDTINQKKHKNRPKNLGKYDLHKQKYVLEFYDKPITCIDSNLIQSKIYHSLEKISEDLNLCHDITWRIFRGYYTRPGAQYKKKTDKYRCFRIIINDD